MNATPTPVHGFIAMALGVLLGVLVGDMTGADCAEAAIAGWLVVAIAIVLIEGTVLGRRS